MASPESVPRDAQGSSGHLVAHLPSTPVGATPGSLAGVAAASKAVSPPMWRVLVPPRHVDATGPEG